MSIPGRTGTAVALLFSFALGCALKPIYVQPSGTATASATATATATPTAIASATDDFKPPAEPLLTVRAPAALPMVQSAPPRDLYSVESTPDYNLTCAELFDTLKKSQPATLEDALQAVHKVRRKFFDRVVFNYQTLNIYNGASLHYPRMAVYGGDAKVILGFAGHPKQKSAERLEVICFDDKENRFDFFDVAFPKQAPPEQPNVQPLNAVSPAFAGMQTAPSLTPEERAQKYVVIPGGRGVRECKNCHGQPSRPIWDTYNMWPGHYGAVDDVLKDRNRPDTRGIYNSFEGSMWNSFQSVPAKNGRYRFVNQELMRPNSDLTLKLSYLNGRRIVGDLKRLGPAFENLKFEFAKALMCAPKAERRFISQLTGDTRVGATFAVLPANSDAITKELFLSAYYDEMQRERRLGGVLAEFGAVAPLPRERFEELRKYYRNLLDPHKELNLDMRLSSVDVDEVLLVRELKKVTDKLDIDMENWSMARGDGYVHENGMGGDGKIALRLILERPFAETFLAGDAELMAALNARQSKEHEYYLKKQNGDAARLATELEQENTRLCNLLAARAK